jgi:hypothetical protein
MKEGDMIQFAPRFLFGTAVVAAMAAMCTGQQPIGSALTYQGRLMEQGVAVQGQVDLMFTAFPTPTGGTPLGNQSAEIVADDGTGMFTLRLNEHGQLLGDFGTGHATWLEISVNGTVLSPRQEIRAAPVALSLPGVRPGPNTCVDQQQLQWDVFASGQQLIQTFTAGMTGFLIGIEVDVWTLASAAYTIHIHSGDQGPVLASTTHSATLSSGTLFIGLDTAVHLVAGEVYTWRIESVGAPIELLGKSGSLYPGGYSPNFPGGDFVFKTLMQSTACGILVELAPVRGDLEVEGNLRVQGPISSGRGAVHTADLGLYSTAPGWMRFVTDGSPIQFFTNPAAGSAFTPPTDSMVMSVRHTGVTIGTSNLGSFRLAVGGEAAKPGGGSWAALSDSRMKEGIRPMQGTLERLLSLRGYEFEYTSEAIDRGLAVRGPQIGLIAEEVAETFPGWVTTDEEGIRYIGERAQTALLVESLRELREEQARELADRDARLEALTRELEALRRLIQSGAARE